MPDTPYVVSEEQQRGLDIARALIAAGVAVFAAPPCPAAHGEVCPRGHTGVEDYDLPPKWQLTVPSMVWLQRWRPGWGLGMVGGRIVDALDEDPRNAGTASVDELKAAGHWPRIFGVAETPSGGFHYLISPLGERKGIVLPGLDYQGGAADGQGRGFVWIAPTVRRSKVDGIARPYRWLQDPDLDFLAEFTGGSDDSGEHIVARLRAMRDVSRPSPGAHRDPYVALSGDSLREFTLTQAKDFCRPYLTFLAEAQVGQIEERCNNAAVQLSHFVGPFWSAEEAMGILRSCLALTAYDEAHPASRWTVDKFAPVLDGRRPPHDAWPAVRVAEPVTANGEPESEVDPVQALLDEMIGPDVILTRPRPKYLVKGLLTQDSASWVIGAAGSKKSFVVLDIAAHVARGMPWQGLKVAQGKVVLVVAEGAGGISLRIAAWQKRYGPMSDDVYILPRPVQSGRPEKWAVLVEACRRIKPVLVVLDTQARVTVGLKENDATDMGIFIDAIGAIREATGACVMPVHHTGRSGGDARGSSALDGAQDTELKIVRLSELTGRLVVEKQKDLPERDPIALTFDVVDLGVDDEGDPVDSLVLTLDPFQSASRGAPEMPEEWETGYGEAQVRLYKILRDQGGDVGLTKAEARGVMVERFYGGDAGRLLKSTWATAWTKCREAVAQSGDPVMVNPSGEKWTVDPVALADLPPRTPNGHPV